MSSEDEEGEREGISLTRWLYFLGHAGLRNPLSERAHSLGSNTFPDSGYEKTAAPEVGAQGQQQFECWPIAQDAISVLCVKSSVKSTPQHLLPQFCINGQILSGKNQQDKKSNSMQREGREREGGSVGRGRRECREGREGV